MLPQVALEGLEVGDLDIAGYEIADVGLEGITGAAILVGEGLPVLSERRVIPLLV